MVVVDADELLFGLTFVVNEVGKDVVVGFAIFGVIQHGGENEIVEAVEVEV